MFEQIASAHPHLIDLLQRSCGLSRADAVQCIAAKRYGHPYRANPRAVIGLAVRRRHALRTLKIAA